MNYEFRSILQGDADRLMLEMADAGLRFDLVLTDPPYNLNKDFGNDSDCLSIPQFVETTEQRLNVVKRLLSPTGSVIWFSIHKYVGHIQLAMAKAGLHYRRMNIWRYENGFSRSKRYPKAEYEPFLWYSTSDSEWTYNADLVRVPYKSKKRIQTPVFYSDARGVRREWAPNPIGRLRGDIWEFPTLAGKRFANERTHHPTQKPESLFIELLKAFCPLNSSGQLAARVLDPFHGSGTTGVCAERLNILGHSVDWIGIEMQEEWVRLARSRIANLRQDLFAPGTPDSLRASHAPQRNSAPPTQHHGGRLPPD